MIEISHIVKCYGQKCVLDNVSFRVGKGEIVGFLGPNGAGKTTTMNILTGYLSANSGSAKIGGIDILENPLEAKKLIGFLPEQPPLYLDMTVKEYLGFVYDLKKCTLSKEKHLREICDVVKISDVYNRIIKNLSKGYRQRVGIAQALVGNPPVLIFDEPTVGLDPAQIVDIRTLISRLGSSHTVILSTHILPEVKAVCDRIVMINGGKIVADGTADEISALGSEAKRYEATICGDKNAVYNSLCDVPGIQRVQIGAQVEDATVFLLDTDPNIDVRKPLFNMLASRGFALYGLEQAQSDLEDIFISLVKKNKSEGGKM